MAWCNTDHLWLALLVIFAGFATLPTQVWSFTDVVQIKMWSRSMTLCGNVSLTSRRNNNWCYLFFTLLSCNFTFSNSVFSCKEIKMRLHILDVSHDVCNLTNVEEASICQCIRCLPSRHRTTSKWAQSVVYITILWVHWLLSCPKHLTNSQHFKCFSQITHTQIHLISHGPCYIPCSYHALETTGTQHTQLPSSTFQLLHSWIFLFLVLFANFF